MKKTTIIIFAMLLGILQAYSQDTTNHKIASLNKTQTNADTTNNIDVLTVKAEPQQDGKYLITVTSKENNLKIRYQTIETDHESRLIKYVLPFKVYPPVLIKVQAYKDSKAYGKEVKLDLCLSSFKNVTLSREPHKKYKGDGGKILTDCENGSLDLNDEKWLGFEGNDMVATIDLNHFDYISIASVYYLVNTNYRIFEPIEIKIEV